MLKKYVTKQSCYLILFSFLLLHPVHALPVDKPCDKADWRCHGLFYFTGGYVWVHTALSDNVATFVPPAEPMITFKNKDAYPSNISGFRLGVGSTLAPNTLFAYEVGYIQTPPQAKKSPDMNISIATKAITADVAYTFNPQSRFPVRAFVGALAVNVIATKTATASGYSLTTSAQDLQPFIGGAFGYQISSRWAVKVVIPYGFVSFSKIVNSNITPFLMINYYPV